MSLAPTRTLVWILVVFLLVNGALVTLNLVGDTVPSDWVKHRITQAIKRHNITTDQNRSNYRLHDLHACVVSRS